MAVAWSDDVDEIPGGDLAAGFAYRLPLSRPLMIAGCAALARGMKKARAAGVAPAG